MKAKKSVQKPPIAKSTRRSSPNPVMSVPPTPLLTEESVRGERKDPSHVSEASSIIDLAMVLGAILFMNTEASSTDGTSRTVGTEGAGRLKDMSRFSEISLRVVKSVR